MIFFSANSDGGNTEGIGAMVQAQLLCYSISKFFNLGFHFSKFKNFTHYQHYNVSQEKFMNDVNEFFNFPSIDESKITKKIKLDRLEKNIINDIIKSTKEDENIILEFNQKNILKFFVSNNLIKESEKNSSIRSLKSNLILNKKFKKPFSKYEKNIAIHIRKYTSTDCCQSQKRDLFSESKQQYYINLTECLSNLYQEHKSRLRIYAQGNLDEYAFLNNSKLSKKHKLSFHIDEYPLTSLFYMINSDVLAMANSSFSWISHLYGNHELVCVKEGFDHPMYSSNLKTINKDGIIV